MPYSVDMPLEERRRRQRLASKRWREKYPGRQLLVNANYIARHPERWAAIRKRSIKKQYHARTPEEQKARMEVECERRRRARQEAIEHYGGKCYCCGITVKQFLSLDHKNGGGTKHRRELNVTIAQWAKRNGWPDSLRVACHNCNHGAYLNGGICPHAEMGGK